MSFEYQLTIEDISIQNDENSESTTDTKNVPLKEGEVEAVHDIERISMENVEQLSEIESENLDTTVSIENEKLVDKVSDHFDEPGSFVEGTLERSLDEVIEKAEEKIAENNGSEVDKQKSEHQKESVEKFKEEETTQKSLTAVEAATENKSSSVDEERSENPKESVAIAEEEATQKLLAAVEAATENKSSSVDEERSENPKESVAIAEEEARQKSLTAEAAAAEKEIDLKESDSKDNGVDDVFKRPKPPSNVKSVEDNFGEYAECVTYEEDGTAIYTDPKTKYQYKWSEKEQSWIQSTAAAADDSKENPFENEHYIWCSETQSWKLKKAQVTETEHYKWNAEKNEWILKTAAATAATAATEKTDENAGIKTHSIDENGQRIYTDKDGTVYIWDEEKNAWFPKIDDDFMARYQMNYGFIDNVSAGEEEKRKKEAEEAKRKAEELERMAEEARAAMVDSASGSGLKRKATQEPPKWFEIDAAHNTKVYVSNLPLDITLDEFAELMGKCGMIMRDPQTQKFKLKLYTEADGQIKGDGLCDYIKVESVNLALNILDEYVYRGHKIRVQRAKFEMRGEYNPALKPKRKKKDKEKLLKMKERLFDWRPEKMRGERTKNEKVVIIKNLFTPDIFEKEVQLILDYQNDLREECGKCGTVRKVIIYDCHPEGVAQINMASPEEADLVIQMMQGRYFGKRQLSAEHWDGKTKYKITESEQEAKERLSNWNQFLETDNTEKAEEKTC